MRRRRPRRRQPDAVGRSGTPRLRPLDDVVALPRRSPLYPELARALRAASALHLLRTDVEPVPVRATATTRQAGCYRSRDDDPIDLRVSRRHDRVALSFLHELGHLVDHLHGWSLGPALAAAAPGLPSRAPAGTGRSRRRYLDSPKEVWARAYAQAVLTWTDDPRLGTRLRDLQERDDAFVWPAAAFAPAADALEDVLGGLGLLRPAVAA